MDRAKVIVIEGWSTPRDLCKRNLERSGHDVLAVASSIGRAAHLLTYLEEDQITLDVAILGDYLLAGGDDSTAREGLAEAIQERFPGVTVIGWRSTGRIERADVEAARDGDNAMFGLMSLIGGLPQKRGS